LKMRIAYFVVGTLAIAALSGCVSVTAEQLLASQRPAPSAVRTAIVQAARDFVYDPYSIRDAEISNLMDADPGRGLQVVCVKSNAKNLMGGYTGRTTTSVRLMNGKPVSALENAAVCQSAGLRYGPFPELESL
jgi:hypothetical protein